MFACESLLLDPQEEADDEKNHYRDTIVVVRRGKCSFQDKLGHVARAGGSAMVLINSEEKLLQLGGLEYDRRLGDAIAVSVKKSDGEKLLELAQSQGEEIRLGLTSSRMTRTQQARTRIAYLLHTNFPLIAYESYMDEVSNSAPMMRDLEALVENLDSRGVAKQVQMPNQMALHASEWIEFFKHCASSFTSQWEFSDAVSLHSSVAAVTLLSRQTAAETPDGSISPAGDPTSESNNNKLWQLAAHKLADAGYYPQSEFCLSQIRGATSGDEEIARCQSAFIKFLRGDLADSIPIAKQCLDNSVSVNTSSESLHVAHDNLVRLAGMDISDNDLRCLHQAATGELLPTRVAADGKREKVICCRRRALPSRDDGSPRARKRQYGFLFHSSFVEEVFHSMNIMGVFLDELGSFNESLRFFHQASQLCKEDPSVQVAQQPAALLSRVRALLTWIMLFSS